MSVKSTVDLLQSSILTLVRIIKQTLSENIHGPYIVPK